MTAWGDPAVSVEEPTRAITTSSLRNSNIVVKGVFFNDGDHSQA